MYLQNAEEFFEALPLHPVMIGTLTLQEVGLFNKKCTSKKEDSHVQKNYLSVTGVLCKKKNPLGHPVAARPGPVFLSPDSSNEPESVNPV